MAEGVNVRFPDKLKGFVEERANTLYGTASEYIRDLVRRDYLEEEAKKWSYLRDELAEGMAADEDTFTDLSAGEVIARNKQ